MARIRTVKPDFFRHEGLQDLELAHPGKYPMMVFAGLWGHCDKAGRFEWKPRTLKLDIFPFLPFDMAEALEILEAAGFIKRYQVDGREYGLIESFAEHQRIGGKEAQDPERFPAPSAAATSEALVKQRGSNGEAAGKQLGLQEGKGREEEVNNLSEQPCADNPRARGSEPPPESARASPGQASAAMRKAGLADANPAHPKLLALLDSGVTIEELASAAADAASKGKTYPYALAVAEGRRRDAAIAPLPAKAAGPPWWSSEAAMQAKGAEFGLSPRPGEDWKGFRGRIEERMRVLREGSTPEMGNMAMQQARRMRD